MGSHHKMADDSRRWDAEKREEVRRQAEMAKAARESTGTKHDHTQFTRNAEGEAQAQFRDEDFDFGVSRNRCWAAMERSSTSMIAGQRNLPKCSRRGMRALCNDKESRFLT